MAASFRHRYSWDTDLVVRIRSPVNVQLRQAVHVVSRLLILLSVCAFQIPLCAGFEVVIL